MEGMFERTEQEKGGERAAGAGGGVGEATHLRYGVTCFFVS